VRKKSKAEGQALSTPTPGDRPSTAHPQPTIEVAAGLVFRAGKLLITQRHPEAHLGGLWEFPGGKREPGETFEQCLVRELREELGVQVEVGARFESVTHAYAEKTVHLQFFLCRLQKGEPQLLGCAALKWVTHHELAAHAFPAADAQLLQKLQDDSQLWR
jgi:8-oxo-dGTP diphosphatase